jgi:hypothetical protein
VNVAPFTTLLPVLVNTTLPPEKETEREHVPPELPVVEEVPVVDLAVVVVEVDTLAVVELVVDDFAVVADAAEPAAQFVLIGDPCVEHWHCSASAHEGVFMLPLLHGTCLYVTTGLFHPNAEIKPAMLLSCKSKCW